MATTSTSAWRLPAIDGDAAGELGDASVAGGADDFGDVRGFAERPDDGVLAPATTDYQNLHPTVAPVAGVIRSTVSRLASLRMKSNCRSYFIATEIDSASDKLRRASLAELPMRT